MRRFRVFSAFDWLLLSRWLFIVACVVWTFPNPASPAEPPRAEPAVEDPMLLTTADREDEFPAIGCAANGNVWVAWVSWDGRRDGVFVRPLEGPQPPAPTLLSGDASDCWRPAMERDGEGRLWVTWAQNDDGDWNIWASYLDRERWSDPIRLTDHPTNDFAQQLAVDARGQLWMVWQSVVDGNYEIQVARVTPAGLTGQQNVSRHPASDWEPAAAGDGEGNLLVVWDSYRNGSYDILLARVTADGQVSEPLAVVASPDYEAHASLAVDPQNRVWIAWDNAGPDWGQHGEKRTRLHSSRSVQLACLVDATSHAGPLEPLSTVLVGELARFCELPRLSVDSHGRLWLILRHLEDVTPKGTRKAGGVARPQQPRGIWNPYALCYADGRWTQPVPLPDSNGRNDMHAATCLDDAGRLCVAWSEDGRRRTRAEEPINHQVRASRLTLPGNGVVTLPVAEPARSLPTPSPLPLARDVRPRHETTVQGTTYQLLFGDTHRHTDISRCGMNFDGSLLDTYRYAIDAAGLDFLAISDHDQDLLKHRYGREQQGPLQDYAWWRSQKYCDLMYIPGQFLPIYGYEHGGSYQARGGHKNVLYLERGHPCYEEDSPEELFAVLRGKQAVVIPHQLADGGSATDWTQWEAGFERVAEIFQARGSYEFFGAPLVAEVQRQGHYLQDALGSGVRIGVVASSDHGLVHGAYAGVYATQFSRRGVLEALQNRRSFGATEMMVLDLRLGDQPLGAETKTAEPPTFDALVRGVKPLALVEIVRDGKILYSTDPEAVTCSFRFTDTDLAPGASAYYYLRSRQTDNEWAWTSAIWVERE